MKYGDVVDILAHFLQQDSVPKEELDSDKKI